MKRCTRICAMNDPDKGCLLNCGENCTIGPDKAYHRPAAVESGCVREKLVELISQRQECGRIRGNGLSQWDAPLLVENEVLADHLIANGVTVQEWIPVTERLPDKPMKCLVYTKRGEYGGCEITYYNQGFYTQYAEVTHWMPLPTPPKGE